VLGSYLHGPGLARNPALADLLLSWVLGVDRADLPPVDDHEEDQLRAQRFSAVDRGNLDGVAERTWKDRLFGRN
jgi:CobQ-like glutamine amidotransferase family enzyme